MPSDVVIVVVFVAVVFAAAVFAVPAGVVGFVVAATASISAAPSCPFSSFSRHSSSAAVA